ncbi:dihydrofolate reductase family protein [Quadrisphaera sp. DSM 44207]|uniref:dihydrofolate reductase family protein n=1 Tax=Quadrisphaera sp. DSM 44207 TaxID=1881057 RepID=UPI00087E5F4B|nr:dihydrofolate reductase family protein [Quadrisphaera sp. DSM 44207]SDQ37638.1 Dihydrofolate reductase [Quadrisphaera sp. DSM 44207]
MDDAPARPRVRYYAAQSLDGYLAETDHSIAWLTGYTGHPADGEPLDGDFERFAADVGGWVMGARTYEFLLAEMDGGAAWPHPDGPTWVLTSRDLPVPPGADVRLTSRPAREVVAEEALPASGGKDVWLVGGGPPAQDLVDAGLLDTVELTVVPVVLGAGVPLFAGRVEEPFALERVRPFANGMVQLVYRAVRPEA